MQDARPALTTDRIVAICRELLIEGGSSAVVVREAARRLSVSAPALYKHTASRANLLTLLITTCHDEVGNVCAVARDGCDPGDSEAQLRAAAAAFRDWAVSHPSEFALLYGQPIVGYRAPPDGATTRSARRLGDVFAGIYAQLLNDGRLRLPAVEDLPPGFTRDLTNNPVPTAQDVPPAAVYQFATGFQRMLGLVSVEVAGHLDWAMSSTTGFAEHQLHALADELILPQPVDPDS